MSSSPSLSLPRLPRWRPLRVRRGHVRLLVAVVALSVLLGGGWMVVRDSSLVAVDRVTVTGVAGPEAGAIREALQTAGEGMTTLHVQPDALRQALAPYPTVKSVAVAAHFPHGLSVQITQRIPVAALVAGGRATPVAADGTLLPGAPVARLAQVKLRSAPAGSAVTDRRTLSTIRLLAFAPAALRAKVVTAFRGPSGLSLHLADGPTVHFGPGTRLTAKWASLAAVLASPHARGATAIDVRVPEHPAAAGLEQGSAQIGQGSTGASG